MSQSGTALLAEMADRSGLTLGLSEAMGDCGISWHTHDPGVVLTHLGVAIANGADCLADFAALGEQDELFGPVASLPTVWRAIEAVTSTELAGIAAALGTARGRVWDAGEALDEVTLDFDATLVTSHSDKQDAAPTYKRGFGFHPLGVWCDETNECLTAMLRAGNAGSNDAADHVVCLDQAIAALPEDYQAGHGDGDDPGEVRYPILARADSAGATHRFVDELVARNLDFSIGYPIDQRVRDALNLTQEDDWNPAINTDGTTRRDAHVVELTDLVDLTSWGEGIRLIARRERPHVGAQLSAFDTIEGWRHTCHITNTTGGPIVDLELRHRGHARVEDRIRNWKDCGLGNLPFEDFVRNQAWLAASIASLMGLNAVLHPVASLWTGAWSPGTLTGLLLYLPLVAIVLRKLAARLPRAVFVGAVVGGMLFHALATATAVL
ncbi:MAG: IS1380 family transposase [Actinomycetia bacterium]|nr:IS1380 family transposase [Actinomycetes bacterium]